MVVFMVVYGLGYGALFAAAMDALAGRAVSMRRAWGLDGPAAGVRHPDAPRRWRWSVGLAVLRAARDLPGPPLQPAPCPVMVAEGALRDGRPAAQRGADPLQPAARVRRGSALASLHHRSSWARSWATWSTSWSSFPLIVVPAVPRCSARWRAAQQARPGRAHGAHDLAPGAGPDAGDAHATPRCTSTSASGSRSSSSTSSSRKEGLDLEAAVAGLVESPPGHGAAA